MNAFLACCGNDHGLFDSGEAWIFPWNLREFLDGWAWIMYSSSFKKIFFALLLWAGAWSQAELFLAQLWTVRVVF